MFVDYHRRLVDADGLTLLPGYADDGLHPHALGYEVRADTLLEALEEKGCAVIARRRAW